ncbi:phosphate/phosphite/phosphonate ABC transporter substrate-binding protein [Desulfurivibrio sp. D14AmB]|uniref:phosphate/phosphite/phosphonate ABC transporter substrate-binding protein n=1 Tax=Desulfurivibrio sp. D14AmB TaxID=3374370 RepID=UPI00376EA380
MKPFFSQKRLGLLLILPLLFWLLAVACERVREGTPEPEGQPRTTLVIGLLPEQDVFVQRKRYAPIAQYLSRQADLDIELRILRRYGNLVDNFTSMGLDGAFLGSFTGALAIEVLGAEPLARPEYPGGVSTYYGMIFVRKDSGIRTAEDMRDKVFAMVDRATTAGWLLPLHYFHQQGIENPEQWLREIYFSGTHEDAIRDVIKGRADIGAAKDLIFDRFADGKARELLEIIEVSPPVPSNTLVLRSDLDPALRERLRQLLLTMHQDPAGREALRQFGAERFLATAVEDYNPVLDYAWDIRLDLADYHYRNR